MNASRRGPIFIVGAGRSGTSILTWSIGQHPNVFVCPETPWLSAYAAYLPSFFRVGQSQGEAGHITMFGVSWQNFAQAMGSGANLAIRSSFENHFPEGVRPKVAEAEKNKSMKWFDSADDPKARWVDGTPASTPYARILADMFPEARFIHLIRDPIEVLKSWLGISWRSELHRDPEEVLLHIYHSQRAGYLLETILGDDRCKRVQFSELVSSPEVCLKGICDFLDESYVPAMVKPIYGERINTFEVDKSVVNREFASLGNHRVLAQLTEWYGLSTNPAWNLAKRDEALDIMRLYESNLPNLPEVG